MLSVALLPQLWPVAQGMSNKQIAQALFVTLRTVEMHLSNAYRELGIASRDQLAASLGAGDRR